MTSSSSTAALAGIKRPRTGSGTASAAAGRDAADTAASAQSPSAAINSNAPPATSGDARTTTRNQDTSTGASAGGGGGVGNDDGEAESSPEGLLMAHALRALTSRQRGQFGAYRAAAFPADAVAAYVSHRLCHNEERRYVRRHGTAAVLGGGGTGEEDGAIGGGVGIGVVPHSGWGRQALRRCPYVDHVEEAAAATATAVSSPTTVAAPPLRDMVAPETEQEITAVVSALAKLHAQRLVAAARRLATAQGHPLREPLRPHHIVQAKRHRTEAGLDPGFFMDIGGGGGSDRAPATSAAGGGGGGAAAAALDVVDAHRLKMEAALEAQREYDAHFGGDDGEDAGGEEKTTKTTKSKRRKTEEKDEDGDTKMEE